MKPSIKILGALSIAWLAVVNVYAAEDIDLSRLREWVSDSFTEQSPGPFVGPTGKEKGGSWGDSPVPVGAMANFAVTGSVMSLVFNTGDSKTNITFAADENRSQRKDIAFAMFYTDTDGALRMDEDTKAALMVIRNSSKQPVFVGYTADGWVELSSPNSVPAFDVWVEGMIRMIDGDERVGYAVKTELGYEMLEDADGVKYFQAGVKGPAIGRFELAGDGAFQGFEGRYKAAAITLRVR